MQKNRLEAFSDGVIAIIITIMVLEFKVPHGPSFSDLIGLAPVFLSYVLSFVLVGIYWNNHHHLLHVAHKINGSILWANLHLLFWLSLTPFVTAWMGENNFAREPIVLYGVVQLMAAIAYYLLSRCLVEHHGADSAIAKAVGQDVKGKVSVAMIALALPLAFVNPLFSFALYTTVALIWFLPDRRIEKALVD